MSGAVADRNPSLVARLRWLLLPQMGYAMDPRSWRDTARSKVAIWVDWLLCLLPDSDLFLPYDGPACTCDYCLGLTDVWTP